MKRIELEYWKPSRDPFSLPETMIDEECFLYMEKGFGRRFISLGFEWLDVGTPFQRYDIVERWRQPLLRKRLPVEI